MTEREDDLLRRWCRKRDLDALAELFDLAAPQLLKLAIHLVGDAAEAEDLVQQTFLTVIERRESLELEGPALPWLIGVLNNKAANARRRSARTLDVSALIEREVETPDAALERRELSGELARAADELDEPYRAVVLLRLRHGLAVADIAHLLERSPGTVRVQLHRAHEKLRRSVPPSLVGALALDLGAFRGLEEIKAGLLQKGAAVALAPSVPTVLGAWIVSQPLLALSACLAAALALSFWKTDDAERDALGDDGANGLVVEVPSEGTQPPLFVTPAQDELPTERVEAAVPAGPTLDHELAGQVLDAETGEPIEGARVELHAPRETTLSRAVADHPELYRREVTGRLVSRTGADWPRLGTLSDSARFDREPFLVYDWPDGDLAPLAVTRTAADGRYALASPEGGGVLVVVREGYAPRTRAAHDPKKPWPVTLRRPSVLSGTLVFDGGLPPRALTLAISALGDPLDYDGHSMPGDASGAAGEPRIGRIRLMEDHQIEGLGHWTVRTDDEGRFRCEVATGRVTIEVVDAGWAIRSPSMFSTGDEARVIVAPVPSLRVVDAATDTPIERVRLSVHERRFGYVRLAGAFNAPGGDLALPFSPMTLRYWKDEALAFTVWAEDYKAARFTLTELHKTGVTEVRLELGSVAAVFGSITRAGAPCSTASLALLAHSPLQWGEEEDSAVDGAGADERGGFQLTAPEGTYILRVRDAGETYFEVVELPRNTPLDIDLEQLASLVVEVHDEAGAPQPGHVVAARTETGRQLRGHADGDGRIRFEGLSPAEFIVMVPDVSSDSSFSGDNNTTVQLERGEESVVRMVIPTDRGPRFAWLVLGGDASEGFEGWLVSHSGYANWTAVDANGRLPLDLNTPAYQFEIQAKDGRRWVLDIPKQADDGVELRLDAGSGSYHGRLIDGDGKPLAGVRLFAAPWHVHDPRTPVVQASTVTDESGAFVLRGLAAHRHNFIFHQDPSRARQYDYDSDYKGVAFLAKEAPADGTWLEIRLATEAERVRLTGVVVRASDGSPLTDNAMFIDCKTPTEFGDLSLARDKTFVHTDHEGRFELLVPRTAERTYRVFSGDREKPIALELTLPDRGLAEPAEVVLTIP